MTLLDVPTTTPAPPGARADRRRHGTGFWLIAAVFLTAMAFSTVPTPLYPLYQARDGFSTFMVTVVFAAYAVGVVISLLLAGDVSDRIGRRRVLVAALALELLAAALFLTDATVPVLIVARLVTGLGVGMVTATATAYLHELHTAHRPGASGQRFEVVSTAANLGGLAVGPLVAGLLAQYVDAPLRTPYVVFAVLLAAGVVAVALAPETVVRPAVAPAYRPQRIGGGSPAAALAGFASFAVFGLFTSVAPGFVAGPLHHPSRALAGAVVFAVFGTAAAAQTLTGRLDPRTRTALGLLAQAAGVVVLVTGMRTASLTAFLLGGVVAGTGAGMLFKAAVATVIAASAPAKRGAALAGLFLVSYLGLSVPALGIGLAVRAVPATTAMTWFAGVLLVVLAGVAALGRFTAARPGTRRSRPAPGRPDGRW